MVGWGDQKNSKVSVVPGNLHEEPDRPQQRASHWEEDFPHHRIRLGQMILLVLRGVIFTCESLGFLFTGKSLGIFTTYVHVDHEGRQLRAICFEFSFFLWILFGGYLVMYVDTGLERPGGGII